MPLFRRKPPKPPEPSVPLPHGETVERGAKATLLYGRDEIDGALFLTDSRLLFEAKKSRRRAAHGDEAEAGWMSVPFDEIKTVELYAAPGASERLPSSRRQCLYIETTKGEQVWWDFGESEEREWAVAILQRSTALRASASEEPET